MKKGEIKTFLKPSIAKIVISIILVAASLISLLTSWATISLTLGEKPSVCYLDIGVHGAADILRPNFFTYIFAPIFVTFYGEQATCNLLILFVGNFIYLYILSCLIIFVYDRIKYSPKNAKMKSREKKEAKTK